MKTNIGIETTDEEREAIANNLSLSYKLAKREDIKGAIREFIQTLIRSDSDLSEPRGPGRDSDDEGNTRHTRLPDRSHTPPDFVPSRGDESYLLKPRDPALRDILSRMLDVSAEFDEYVWQKHNDNRIYEKKTYPRGD